MKNIIVNKKVSSAIVTLSMFASIGVSAQSPAQHDANVNILNSIPLVDGYEQKVSGEDQMVEELVGIFKDLADKNKRDGKLNRGTHNKGTCIDGSIKVLSAQELQNELKYLDNPDKINKVIGQIKSGFFKNSGEYSVQTRFANAKGTGEYQADTEPDVRGMSISIDTKGKAQDFSGGDRLDFMMNSSPMFAVDNITEFTNLMRLVSGKVKDIELSNTPAILKAGALLSLYETNDVKSYAYESYWSNLPYVHGLKADGSPAQIAKYKLTPCDGLGRRAESSANKTANYLQSDIKALAAQGGICFNLQVQIYDKEVLKNYYLSPARLVTNKYADEMNFKFPIIPNKKSLALATANTSDAAIYSKAFTYKRELLSKDKFWIENGGTLWPESILPYYTVARITVEPGTEALTQESCDQRYFNTRLHATPENMPIGSIARVRVQVEEVSRSRRMNEIP